MAWYGLALELGWILIDLMSTTRSQIMKALTAVGKDNAVCREAMVVKMRV